MKGYCEMKIDDDKIMNGLHKVADFMSKPKI